MANEPVAVEILEKDILERAGLERRDDVPICIEAAWGGQTFTVGEPHPLISGHLIFAVFQTPTEIRVYSLCPQSNGAAKSPKEEMRANPTRTTLAKTARTHVVEVMVFDVFVESIAQDLVELRLDTYGEPEPEPANPPNQPAPPAPAPAAG